MTKKDNQITVKSIPTTTIHALSHDGRGIATIDSKTTFLNGGLPTEKVTYRINNKRATFNEGDALDILEPSAERVTPPCEHAGLCGGCSLQHMSPALQIVLKQKIMLDQLKHFGHVTPDNILAPLAANNTGYRRKARLGVRFVIKKDKVLVGFREKKSRYLADLSGCKVLHPQVGENFELLRTLIASLDAMEDIPQIEIAVGDQETALVFRHMKPLSEGDQLKLFDFGKQHHFHIYLQPNNPLPITCLYPEQSNQRLTYTLPDQDLTFLFHPLDFTQINLEMNRLMVNQALDLLDVKETDTILDLFSGIGNFTLPLARKAKHVTGVEGGEEMVIRAGANAAHNHIENVAFYAANLMSPPTDASWMKQTYDKILLDPPRAGAKEILPFIEKLGAKKIVYVSCNPATLARDAGELVNTYGFKLTHAGIMNMFPHTSHIEAMAVFTKE